jgi:hypothetical protein
MSCRQITGILQSILCLIILFLIVKIDYFNCNCEKATSKYVTIGLSLLVLLSSLLLIFGKEKDVNLGANFLITLCLIFAILSYLVKLKKSHCKCIRLNDTLYNILSYITTPIDKLAKIFMYFMIIVLVLGVFFMLIGYRANP